MLSNHVNNLSAFSIAEKLEAWKYKSQKEVINFFTSTTGNFLIDRNVFGIYRVIHTQIKSSIFSKSSKKHPHVITTQNT